jgi:hypothetical protein
MIILKWKYTFTPVYAGTIREGVNRITARLLCQANPANLTKFYSINVTGINGILPKSSAITRNTPVAPLSSNSSSYLFHPTPVINHLSLPTNSNSSASSERSGIHLTVSLAKTILTVRAVSIKAATVATAITNVI